MSQTTIYRAAPSEQLSATSKDHIWEELRRYQEHLRDVRGLSNKSCQARARVVAPLLRQKFSDCPIDIARLRPEEIRRFLASQLDAQCSRSKAAQLATALRSYLRYRSICGDSIGTLSAAISSPVHWRLASLPRALKFDEVERLLNSFGSVRRWPKRGYAIVRCALDMGLRAGEIAHLTIQDIDWRAGTVTLKGTKSLRQDILPLPVETGQALADYLQHERPRTTNPAIFVRHQGANDRPITSDAIQGVIRTAFRRVGLSWSGSHALRHTLACQLVENGSSLKEVADVLRHRSLETTRIYAKLDTPKLFAVALPWPGSRS
jgi:integrase